MSVKDTNAETDEDLIAAEEEAAVVAADEKAAKRDRGGMGGGPLLALMSAGAGLSTVLSASEAFAGVTRGAGPQASGLISLIGVSLTAVAAMAVKSHASDLIPQHALASLVESLRHTIESILRSVYTTNKTHDEGIHHIATRPPMDPLNKGVYFLTLRIEGNELDLVAKKSRADIEAHQALLQFKPEAARHLPRLYATVGDIAVMERLRGLESSELEAAVLKDEGLRVEYIQQAWQMMKEVSRSGLSLRDVGFLQGHNIIYDSISQNLRLIELGSLTKESIFSPEEVLSNLLLGESIQSDLYFDLLSAAFRDKDPSEFHTLPQWLQSGHPKFEEQAESLLAMMTPEEIDELHRSSRETWIVPFVSHAGGDYPMRFSKALIQAVVSGDRGAALEILKKGQAIDFVDDPQDPLHEGYLLSDLESYRKIDRKELVSIGGGFYRLKSNPHAAGNSMEGGVATQTEIGDTARRWRGPAGRASPLLLLAATSAGLATLLDSGHAHASDGTVSGAAVSLLQILGAFGAGSLVTWLAMKYKKSRALDQFKLPPVREGSEGSHLGPYRMAEKRIKEFPLMPEDVVLEFHENGVPKRVKLGSERLIDGIMVHSESMTWREALGRIYSAIDSDVFMNALKLASASGLVGAGILAMLLDDPLIGLSGEGLVLLLSTAAQTTYYKKKHAVVLEFFSNGQLKEVHLRQSTPLQTVEGEAIFTGKVEFHPNGIVKRGTIASREVDFDEPRLPPPADSPSHELTEYVEPRYRVRVQDTSAETEEVVIAAEEEAAVAADEKDSKRGRGGMGGLP
ncbi:MAG: hypothetical protein K8R69_03125 [Deltaproteobacteria bacterium]|nr:hypothetical protein [Deltaproteobacteria bacterium]